MGVRGYSRDVARLGESIGAYRAALTVLSRERTPVEWARVQHHLGIALWTFGECSDDAAWLEQSVSAYRAALTVFSRERIPVEWAETTNNLGIALRKLGERERSVARIEEAAIAFSVALEELRNNHETHEWQTTARNLNETRALHERLGGNSIRRQMTSERTKRRIAGGILNGFGSLAYFGASDHPFTYPYADDLDALCHDWQRVESDIGDFLNKFVPSRKE